MALLELIQRSVTQYELLIRALNVHRTARLPLLTAQAHKICHKPSLSLLRLCLSGGARFGAGLQLRQWAWPHWLQREHSQRVWHEESSLSRSHCGPALQESPLICCCLLMLFFSSPSSTLYFVIFFHQLGWGKSQACNNFLTFIKNLVIIFFSWILLHHHIITLYTQIACSYLFVSLFFFFFFFFFRIVLVYIYIL